MIDLIKAKKEFEKYVETYGKENPNILKKIEHSYRVFDVS